LYYILYTPVEAIDIELSLPVFGRWHFEWKTSINKKKSQAFIGFIPKMYIQQMSKNNKNQSIDVVCVSVCLSAEM